jgi:ERCC4-type nuclease
MQRIDIRIDSNERNSDRANCLIIAALSDQRFNEPEFSELPVDVQFTDPTGKRYNVELKEPEDYIQSVLGKNGHLYNQYLNLQEAGCPGMILVLGGDNEISLAIQSNVNRQQPAQIDWIYTVQQYEKRLHDFEANAEAVGIPVERWLDMPYSRLMSRVAKCFDGGSLMSYRPRPEIGERAVAALCLMVPGIGEKKSMALLQAYNGSIGDIILAARHKPETLQEVPGIGPKLAEAIQNAMR